MFDNKAIEIKSFKYSHDRFMIINDVNIYHIGASLKDLGKKWFAFFKLDIGNFGVFGRLEKRCWQTLLFHKIEIIEMFERTKKV